MERKEENPRPYEDERLREKKPYERPELVRYGRIQNLTQGSSGLIADSFGGGFHG